MNAIRLPNKVAIPNRKITKPRYIGFLENLKGPESARFFGVSPGIMGVSIF